MQSDDTWALSDEAANSVLAYLDATCFTGASSMFGLLLGYCAFTCTHGPPKSFLVSISRGLIDCAQALDLYQATTTNTSNKVAASTDIENDTSKAARFKAQCAERVSTIFDEVNYTIGYVAHSLI